LSALLDTSRKMLAPMRNALTRSSRLTFSGGWRGCRGRRWTVLDGAQHLVELLCLGDRPPVQFVGLLPQLGGGRRVPPIGVPQHPGRMLRDRHRILRAGACVDVVNVAHVVRAVHMARVLWRAGMLGYELS
jgi:hypothetical protein